MAAGLLAAAIGGFGKALSGIGEMEAKKQNEAKLRREIMNMESEEALRLDEIKFNRKIQRAPIEAVTTAKADVAGKSAALDEADRLSLAEREAAYEANKTKAGYAAKTQAGVPEAQANYEATVKSEEYRARKEKNVVEAEAREGVRRDVAKLVAENGSEKAKLLAQQKVNNRLAELAAITDTKLDEAEARAKHNAFMTDLRIAKELGVDVAEMERAAEKEKARIDALIKSNVPKSKAEMAAIERAESARALLDKNVAEEEAKFLAKQELAKIQAMTAQGVPEAEAKLLAAKWRAGKTQRDEAAAEKTQQEITDAITRAGNKKYLSAERAIAVNKNVPSSFGKTRDDVNTADLGRKLDAAEADLADALGVSKNEISEEIRDLEDSAKKDPAAQRKLDEIKPLRDAVKKRRSDLQNWRDKPEESSNKSSSSSATYNYVPGKGLVPTK
jgi:hypothetical protein